MNDPFPFNQPIGNLQRVGGVMTPPYAPSNSNLSGCWAKPIRKFLIIPEGDTFTYILYLVSNISAPCAFGGVFGGSISGGIVVSSGYLKTERS